MTCGCSSPPAPRSSVSPPSAPQDEETPIRPVSPYGAAKAFAHHVAASSAGAGCSGHGDPLQPRVAAPARDVRDAQDHEHGGRDRGWPGEPLALGNLDACRTGAGRPTTSTPWSALSSRQPGDYVVATGHAHSVRDFVARPSPRRHRRVGTSSTSTRPCSAQPTRACWSATPGGPARSSAGSRPSASRTSWPGWSTPRTCRRDRAAHAWRSPTTTSPSAVAPSGSSWRCHGRSPRRHAHHALRPEGTYPEFAERPDRHLRLNRIGPLRRSHRLALRSSPWRRRR